MAIEQITFTNDPVTGFNTSGVNAAFINGSIQVDYDNSPATVSGSLTVTDANGSENFGPFSLLYNSNNNTYLLSGFGQTDNVHDSMNLIYQGQAPTSATDISVTKGGNNFNTVANDPVVSTTVCFVSGTRIGISCGEKAVEELNVGDIAVTTSGALRPIRWLGHRTTDCRRHPHPEHVMPVRIAAHAFGENRPTRDLFVSPGHAICVDVVGEVLVPAGLLVNGSTIVQVEVDEVTYWHVELESHDVILAENLPAESYLDMGNRGFFREADVVALAAGPDAPVLTHAAFCRPYVDGGPVLDAVRAQLAARAAAMAADDERKAA